MRDFLNQYWSGKPGIVHTEFQEIRDALTMMKKCKVVGERKVILGTRKVTFWMLETNDLAQTYGLMRRFYKDAM